MQSQQTKKIIINIVTGVLVVGILGSGYWVLTKDRVVETGEEAAVSTMSGDTQVVQIGIEIARTRKDLEDLRQSVSSAKNIFNMPSFKNLEDLSIVILPERIIKRENPFATVTWKARAEKQVAAQTSTSTQSLTGN